LHRLSGPFRRRLRPLRRRAPSWPRRAAAGPENRSRESCWLDADEELLDALGEHLPRLRLVIDDLGKQSDDQLYARAATSFARLVLGCLENGREAGWLGGEAS